MRKIVAFFRKKVVYHSIVWLSLFALLLFLSDNFEMGYVHVITNQVVKVMVLMGIVYMNFYYFMPKYLDVKLFGQYFIMLTGFIFVLTSGEITVLYLKAFFLDQAFTLRSQKEIIDSQISIFLVNLMVGYSATMSKITVDWFTHQRERQRLLTQTMQSELRFLRSQINPHFLFNTLNSLYALTLKKSDDAPDIVLKLSEMMRYMLYECNERFVDLSKEINYIQNYLDLERVRHGNKGTITFESEGEPGKLQIAPLMFIPFLENAFKHGLNAQFENGFVDSILIIEGKNVHFHIENSKAPAAPSISNKKSGGIGLQNVRRRLELLYPNKYELMVKDTPNTYIVDLNIEV